MKRFLKLFMALLIITQSNLYSQQISKRVKKYVLVDITHSSIKANDTFNVMRLGLDKKPIIIGKIKIVKVLAEQSAAEIIQEKKGSEIRKNDFIQLPENAKSINRRTEAFSQPDKRKKHNLLGYSSIGAGIIISGLGYYFYNQANQTYTDYKAATTTNDAVRRYDETIQYYDKSKISFGIGGGLAAVGIIYSIIHRSSNSAQNQSAYRLMPMISQNTLGLKLQFVWGK